MRNLLLITSILLASCALTDPPPTPTILLTLQDLDGAGDEVAALKAVRAGKYVKARELAEAILADRKDSFLGIWVLANVYYRHEGNLPRALFLLRKTKRMLLHSFFQGGKGPELAQTWHKQILWVEESLVGEMDEREAQLAIIDEHDELYKPLWKNRRIWPLMKLKRFDEAREIALERTLSDKAYERAYGYNGLLAIASEARDREGSYKWGTKGAEATGNQYCILFHNLVESSMAVFKYAEAEAFGKKAINAKRHDCPNSTYGDLAKLYLLRGDFQQTHSALKKLREIGAPPKYRDQFEKGNRSARARLFFALGMLNGAEELTRPAFKAPDRGGMTSSSEERIRFGGAIDHAMVLQARLEDEREKRSIRPLGEWFDRTLAIQALEFEHWEVGRVALHLVAHDEELETNIRPYMAALLPWYTGTLIELFGTGVVSKAVARARELDRDAPKTEAFYDAFDGEIAWRRGDYEEAIALAKSALTNLPKEEKLLRWRTRTWLGDAYAARGQAGFASAEWGIVLEHYPSALRHLGVKLAVTIEPDDDPKSLEIATRLRDSHRLRFDIPAFLKLNVTAGERHEICLMTTGNHRYNCVLEPEAQELQDEEKQDPVLALLDRFHRKMFQPKIELSQADINSLDGSPVRVNADSVMEGLLGKKEKKE